MGRRGGEEGGKGRDHLQPLLPRSWLLSPALALQFSRGPSHQAMHPTLQQDLCAILHIPIVPSGLAV